MPEYQKIIVSTLWRRAEYTQRMINALEKCRGIEDYLVIFHCEPGFPKVVDIANKAKFNKEVFVNDAKLGCTTNIFAALNDGFARSDYVIMVEDDVLLAPDALEYFEWARMYMQHNQSIFSVAAYRKEVVNPDQFYTLFKEDWFTPWGWATWYDRFDMVRKNWPFGRPQSWDQCVNKARRGKFQLVPYLSRSQNIGAMDGAYCPGPQWHKENQFNPFWAGDGEPLKTILSQPAPSAFCLEKK